MDSGAAFGMRAKDENSSTCADATNLADDRVRCIVQTPAGRNELFAVFALQAFGGKLDGVSGF